ncbi:MAG: cell wall hydrolase [Allosphingosinicella sp.]
MKRTLGVGAAAGLILYAAQAQGGGEAAAPPSAAPALPRVLGWQQWSQSLRAAGVPAPATTGAPLGVVAAPAAEIDVVDAHWMALTMWGEARGDGEAAMRAVGHVIENRQRAARDGAFVTDTVSAAWQFSCWNPGDPNLAAMQNVDRLRAGSREQQMWQAARRIAEEIMAGQSEDPTRGALFYHTAAVAPAWSRGIAPVARIGRHLFFPGARRA